MLSNFEASIGGVQVKPQQESRGVIPKSRVFTSGTRNLHIRCASLREILRCA